ncbi:MAG: hypothetical protein Q8J74_01075 [Candidatus Didemnitutus sp.]|nr:hypothetical protein [Candidatus Didemnitutus sp.]
MNSEQRTRAWGLGLLLVGGMALNRLERALTPAPQTETRSGLVAFFAAAGGASTLAADWFWLRTNLAWETRDEAGVRALLRLTLAAAPRSEYFRFQAARMLAYDVPRWRIARNPAAPLAVHDAWRLAGADEAINLVLEEAGDEPERWLEAATLTLYARRDRVAATELFGFTATLSGAPWHAGRIYAQLLVEQGREAEALAWLRRWLPQLPEDDPGAQRQLVLDRLAALEFELWSRGEPL